MPYPSEPSNHFGLKEFLEGLSEEDLAGYDRLLAHLEELARSLKREDVLVFSEAQAHLVPIAISVDGGEGLAFRRYPVFSVGMIRVTARGHPSGSQGFQPLVYVLPSPALLDGEPGGPEGKEGQDRGFQSGMRRLFGTNERGGELSEGQARSRENENFARRVVHTFSQATGIVLEDLGSYYTKDIEAFTRVLREILEWAYLVWAIEQAKQFPFFKGLLFIKDGRLAQAGVKKDFREKLMAYFEANHVFLAGVSKTSRLIAEGLTSLVVGEWLESQRDSLEHGRFLIRVPEDLLKAAYKYERQWNAEAEGAFVMGRRYVMRLFEHVFHPLDSVVVFDVPEYLSDEEVKTIASALHAQRSFLFGGSIGSLVDAHAEASISRELVGGLEGALLERLKGVLGEKRWLKFRRLMWP